MSSRLQHSAPSITFLSQMGASTRGIVLGSLHSSVRLHTSVWPQSPPLRRGSPDSSKQRLKCFCTTAGTFLPPSQKGYRRSPSIGPRTRLFQPLFPCTKEGRQFTTHSISASSKPLPLQREVQDVDVEDYYVSDSSGILVTVDMKDTYFHIQVVQRHRKFFSFAFGGKAYQYKVLPFGLALAQRTFKKCMDTALAPLRLLGLLHMRQFLWWMKLLGLHSTRPVTCLICLQSGVRMGMIHLRQMVSTDASLTGWGAVFEGRPVCGLWTGEFLSWHINCLELRAVFLALIHFLPFLKVSHVIVRTDNMAVVSHINR